MTIQAATVIELAKKELGYREKATNSNLDSKTENAGSNNYTKYARDLYSAGYYNGNKNGYPWCDVFVDWLFYKAFGKTKGQEVQCQTGDLGAGCAYSASYYQKQNRFGKTPEIGDQIFFVNNGIVNHTGLVVRVDAEKVYTIEGNTSRGCVAEKTYSRNDSCIYGYGKPKYDSVQTCTIVLPVLRKGTKSGHVKTLQILLNKYNSANIAEDGSFGPNTYSAVRTYQKSRGLEIDGIVGPKTWSQLLK